jgi:uncharacterized protein YlzI (FlbEa/FlbD family)
MFITVTLFDGRKMYMDIAHITAITVDRCCPKETIILFGGWEDCVYVRETPEEIVEKIQNANK